MKTFVTTATDEANRYKGCEEILAMGKALRMSDLASYAVQLLSSPEADEMSHCQFAIALLTHVMEQRQSRSIEKNIRQSGVDFIDARVSGIDWEANRNLSKSTIYTLATCDWLRSHRDLLITGPSGVGKTWGAEALANVATMKKFKVLKVTWPSLVRQFNHYASEKLMEQYDLLIDRLAKPDLLLIDDWGWIELTNAARSGLLHIIKERHQKASTVIISTLPVDKWKRYIDAPSTADQIVQRINRKTTIRIDMQGMDMRDKESLEEPHHDVQEGVTRLTK